MSLSTPLPPPADPSRSPDLAALADAVGAVTATDPHALTATERKTRLAGLRAAIDALEVAFDTTVAAADTAGDGQLLDGATSTAAWLRHTLRLAPRDAAGHVRTARMLRPPGPAPAAPAAAAVLAGTISYPHLQAITGTLADLTDHPGLPPAAQSRAVELMVDLATEVDPAGLRAAARHLRYVLDPDRGKADHDRQTQARRASLAPLLDGTWRLEMLTTAEGGALLTQLLAATGAPTSSDDARTPAQRRHDALIDALQAAAQSDQLPIANGLSPHILITTPPAAFLPPPKPRTGELATEEPLTRTVAASQLRRRHPHPRTPLRPPHLQPHPDPHPPRTRRRRPRRRPRPPLLHQRPTHRPLGPRPRLPLPRLHRPLDPRPPHHRLATRRHHRPRQRTPALRPPPPRRPRRPLDHHHRPRRRQQHHHLHPPHPTHHPPQPHPPTRPPRHRVTTIE